MVKLQTGQMVEKILRKLWYFPIVLKFQLNEICQCDLFAADLLRDVNIW